MSELWKEEIMDIFINLIFEPSFWVVLFLLAVVSFLTVSALDRRTFKNSNYKSKNYEDFRDDGL